MLINEFYLISLAEKSTIPYKESQTIVEYCVRILQRFGFFSY